MKNQGSIVLIHNNTFCKDDNHILNYLALNSIETKSSELRFLE